MKPPKWLTPEIKQKFDVQVELRNGVRLAVLTRKGEKRYATRKMQVLPAS